MYTDLTQTQLAGGTETDLLREVTINTSFKGRRQYEPMHLQYLPIRKNIFDTVEVGISEIDGSQTQLNGDETILTVKFRRHSSNNQSTERMTFKRVQNKVTHTE